MKSQQLILLTLVSMWVLGDIFGASHAQNAFLSIAMAVGIAINENVHKRAWDKIKEIAHV
jgi:hypothetical protein